MSLIDFARGVGIIVVIMVVAGAIAYVGDRVGHQVGRKRLTLFNIRPKYTSTIVAVATGVLIAFVVTMAAIVLNQQVKTAFFRLNSINERIGELERQRSDLESKVNGGVFLLSKDTLLSPYFARLLPTQTESQRREIIRNFVKSTITYINTAWTPLGLRPYQPSGDVDKKIDELARRPDLEAELDRNVPVLLAVTTDKNLYQNDTLSYTFQFISDNLSISRGATLAQFPVPKGQAANSANVDLAIGQLETRVSLQAQNLAHLPPFIASHVVVTQVLPQANQVRDLIAKNQGFYLTAYAAADVFPHDGQVPIVVVVSPMSQ